MTNLMMLTLILGLSVLMSSCSSIIVGQNSEPSKIPSSVSQISDLWVSDPASNLASSKVLILLQGGPKEFLYFQRDGRTMSRYLPGYNDRHVIYLHQAQTLNPDLFKIGEDFTIEQARVEMMTTTNILHQAIQYFKGSGKSVTVIGHSYGAFIINHYLATYEPKADGYILSAGRVTVPLAMVADNRNGMSSSFEKDGVTYIPATERKFPDDQAYERGAYFVRAMLKAAYGEPRYNEGLADRDLSTAFYVTGKSDQHVGVLTPAETSFLESRGAKVLTVEGGHYDVYKRMIDAVQVGEIKL